MKSNALGIASLIGFLLGSGVVPASASEGEIPWIANVKKAFGESGSSSKPIFIDAWAVWCVPCKEMDETTYRDPAIVEAMTGFVPLKVDQDSSGNFCERHEISALPLVLFLDAEAREIGRRTGLQRSDDLLESMNTVRAGYTAYLEAIENARKDPEAAAAAGDYLARSGNPQRAIGLLRRAIKGASSPDQAERFALGLAHAQLAAGDARAATAGFRKLADEVATPEMRGRALEGLALAYRARGRDADADTILRQLQEESGD